MGTAYTLGPGDQAEAPNRGLKKTLALNPFRTWQSEAPWHFLTWGPPWSQRVANLRALFPSGRCRGTLGLQGAIWSVGANWSHQLGLWLWQAPLPRCLHSSGCRARMDRPEHPEVTTVWLATRSWTGNTADGHSPARGVDAGSHRGLMGITYGCVYCSNKESLSLALAQDLCLGKRLSLNRPTGAFVFVGDSLMYPRLASNFILLSRRSVVVTQLLHPRWIDRRAPHLIYAELGMARAWVYRAREPGCVPQPSSQPR